MNGSSRVGSACPWPSPYRSSSLACCLGIVRVPRCCRAAFPFYRLVSRWRSWSIACTRSTWYQPRRRLLRDDGMRHRGRRRRRWAGRYHPLDRRQPRPSLIVTGVVGVRLSATARARATICERLMYGERDDPYNAIAGLVERCDFTTARCSPSHRRRDDRRYARSRTTSDSFLPTERRSRERSWSRVWSSRPRDTRFPLADEGIAVGDLRLARRSGERLRERDDR